MRCMRHRSTAAASTTFSGQAGLAFGRCSLHIAAGIDEMLLAPAWKGVGDPIEKVFALLARYRQSVVRTDCVYGCPIGSLALEDS